MIAELALGKLRRAAEVDWIGCASSDAAGVSAAIVGQERALKSLRFGLGIRTAGFNIYVAGLPGTGRTTTVQRFLNEMAQSQPVPDDWCYVNNFRDPYRPHALRLPAGRGREFRSAMRGLIEAAQRDIRRAFESDEYDERRKNAVRMFQQPRDQLFEQINQTAYREGFVIRATPVGLALLPIREGKPLGDEELAALSSEERETISEKRKALQGYVEDAIKRARSLEKEAETALRSLDQEVALYALSHLIGPLKLTHADLPLILQHLDAVQSDILENLDSFRGAGQEEQQPQSPQTPRDGEQAFRRYEVNVLVDHSELQGAPVIAELNPTFSNLMGRVEQEARFGVLATDFTLIRDGSLHRANGGYLVLPVEDLLRSPLSWESLKRTLRNREIVIEDAAERMGFIATRNLRPEPIPLELKVILIGPPALYYMLYQLDDDFGELFKVKAEFDTAMERTPDHVRDYVAFVCTLCQAEGLHHLDGGALGSLIEHGSRLAGDQEKLSTRFGEIADIIREASYYAEMEEAQLVSGLHVRRAVEERFYRSALVKSRIQEMIQRGSVLIDVSGEQVGQLNGLSVLGAGDVSFGQPSRITATIGMGQEGVIDIEREAKLSGPIHTKGVLILSGYLTEMYARDYPFSLSARLVFEQSYGGVEGDSSSSTELYALLSGLSGLPIRQGLAVTGSVNQKGQVQAIGGVNEKIEGYFEICRSKGLTGDQGVLIPAANVTHLMLREEVVEAVAAGRFHIYAVSTIDEGIELLTGVPAGARRADGSFDEGSVHARVDQRLRQLAVMLAEFGKPKEAEKRSESSDAAPA